MDNTRIMGHNNNNKSIFEREVGAIASSVSPDGSASMRKLQPSQSNKPDLLLASVKSGIDKTFSYVVRNEISDNSPKTVGCCTEVVHLVFNISPQFFHVHSINKDNGRTFNHLYDYGSGVRPLLNEKSIADLPPVRETHKLTTSYKHLSSSKPCSMIKFNIFRESCACLNCLSASYIFPATEAVILRREFIYILSCDCYHWDEYWLKTMVEHIYLFFGIVESGVIYDRLLETASLCAKMLLIKAPTTHVMEMQYSYVYFLLGFMQLVYTEILEKRELKSTNNEQKYYKISTIIPFEGTGKEKVSIIDGITVVSFKTEQDMNEYTDLETCYLQTLRPPSPDSDDSEIVPTKTTDITKIKGWRNKVFSPVGSQRSCKIVDKRSEVKKYEKCLPKQKGTLESTVPRDHCEEPKPRKLIVKRTADLIQKPVDHIDLTVDESSQLAAAYPKLTELLRKEIDVSFVNREIDSTSNENIVSMSQHSESELLAIEQSCVFESGTLQEFLKGDSGLNLSYETPTLHTAGPVKPLDKPAGKNKAQETIDKLESKSETAGNAAKKDEKVKQYYERRKTRKAARKNPRYIWVQGRPIQLVNGYKDEVITPKILNCENSSRSSVTKSREAQAELNVNEENGAKSINEEGVDVEEDVRRPRLLPTRSGVEVECTPKRGVPPHPQELFSIPVMHKCVTANTCSCRNFTLGVLVTVGLGRRIPEKVVNNLQLLFPEDNRIDQRMAYLAASAVPSNSNWVGMPLKRRMVVPVVDEKILKSVKCWEERLALDRLVESMPANPLTVAIDPGVRSVVDGLLDCVEKTEETLVISYDPMHTPSSNESPKRNRKPQEKIPKAMSKVERELRRLINVSIIDESQDSCNEKLQHSCENDFCLKGCVCHSLNSKINYSLHCGNIDCMFQCTCDKAYYQLSTIKGDQVSDTILAKEEMTWHQTVIRSEDGVEIMNVVDKCKREKKLPTRFRNNVLLGREMYPTLPTSIVVPPPSEESHSPPDIQSSVDLEKSKASLRSQVLKRRLDFCSGFVKGSRTLADVFIWCGIHDKYNCLCVSWICRMKNNAFLWKPGKYTRYLPHKAMAKMELKSKTSHEVFLYDTKRFSARTYGTSIEYAVRNRSETFIIKRNYEFENGVLSNTNSYVKMKFFMVKDKDYSDPSVIEQFPEVIKSNLGKIIKIVTEADGDDFIEIEDNNYTPPPVMQFTIEPEEDCEVIKTVVVEKLSGVILQTRKDSSKIESSISGTGKALGSSLNLPIRSYSRLNKPNVQLSSIEFVDITQTRSDNDPDTDNDLKRRLSPDVDPLSLANDNHATEEMLNNKIKKKKKREEDLFVEMVDSDPQIRSLAMIGFKEKIDPELENELIHVDRHPLKFQLYGADGMPKLALLCLTPGIGYLPIIEFTSEVLAVQDPVFGEIFHSFKNLEAANHWLNKFFKNRLIFESIDTNLKWVIVKPGILKLKRSPAFSPALLENPSIVITRDGGLIFKKKDLTTGGVCRGAIKVEPLSLDHTRPTMQQITVKEHPEDKKRAAQLRKSVVNIRDSQGKKRKIHLDTQTLIGEPVVKAPVQAVFRPHLSLKVQELPSTPIVLPKRTATILPKNSVVECQPGGLMRLNTHAIHRKGLAKVIETSKLANAKKPFLISGPASGPIRVQLTPSGVQNLGSRLVTPVKATSPLTIRTGGSNVVRLPMVNNLTQLSGPRIVSQDGRRVIIHNSTMLPLPVNINAINMKAKPKFHKL